MLPLTSFEKKSTVNVGVEAVETSVIEGKILC